MTHIEALLILHKQAVEELFVSAFARLECEKNDRAKLERVEAEIVKYVNGIQGRLEDKIANEPGPGPASRWLP